MPAMVERSFRPGTKLTSSCSGLPVSASFAVSPRILELSPSRHISYSIRRIYVAFVNLRRLLPLCLCRPRVNHWVRRSKQSRHRPSHCRLVRPAGSCKYTVSDGKRDISWINGTWAFLFMLKRRKVLLSEAFRSAGWEGLASLESCVSISAKPTCTTLRGVCGSLPDPDGNVPPSTQCESPSSSAFFSIAALRFLSSTSIAA